MLLRETPLPYTPPPASAGDGENNVVGLRPTASFCNSSVTGGPGMLTPKRFTKKQDQYAFAKYITFFAGLPQQTQVSPKR